MSEAFTPETLTPEAVDPHRYYRPAEVLAMPPETQAELRAGVPAEVRELLLAELNVFLVRTYGTAEVTPVQRLTILYRLLSLLENGFFPHEANDPGRHITWAFDARVVPLLAAHGDGAAGVPALVDAPEDARRAPRAAVIAVAAALLLLFGAGGLLLRGSNASARAESAATATAAAEAGQPAPTATLRPQGDLDAVIDRGDAISADYAVTLRAAGRLWTVQQVAVETAQWTYDRSPDVASLVLGLPIRRVVGLPYAPENLAFLRSLDPGEAVHLDFNSGATLRFVVEDRQRLSISDAQLLFAQETPGLAIALLGEPDSDTRLVIFARTDEGTGERVSGEGGSDAAQFDDLTVRIASVATVAALDGVPIPPDWMALRVTLAADGDLPAGVSAALRRENGLLSASLARPEEVPTFTFLVPRSMRTGTLFVTVGAHTAGLHVEVEPPSAYSAADLVAQLGRVLLDPDEGRATLELRVYNPTDEAITLAPGDVALVTAPAAGADGFPVGPAQHAFEGLPREVPPGEALDLTLPLPWDGAPALGIEAAGWRWSLTVDD